MCSHHQLDAEILALPTATEALAEERRAWVAVDGAGGKVARKFLTAWPKPHTTFTPTILCIRYARYLAQDRQRRQSRPH